MKLLNKNATNLETDKHTDASGNAWHCLRNLTRQMRQKLFHGYDPFLIRVLVPVRDTKLSHTNYMRTYEQHEA